MTDPKPLKPPGSELGGRVRMRRIELGMSMRELGRRVGLSHERIRQIEEMAGQLSQNATSDATINRLAAALDIKPEYLLSTRPERKVSVSKTVYPVTDISKKSTKLGMFLRSRRLELNLSQQKVGQAAGMRRYKLSTLEGGKTHASRDVLERLSAVLKCKIPPDLLPDCDKRKGFI